MIAPDTQIKIVPRLRFRGFSDEWQEKKLGDISQFAKGKNISKDDISEDGKTEAIRYGELYTRYNEVIDKVHSRTNLDPSTLALSKSNDVIIPASGETSIDIATASCVLKDNIALSGDINIIRTENNGVFLAYYLNNSKKLDIARLAQGNSVVHLYPSSLKSLTLNLPALKEQEKIAKVLTVAGDKISALQNKKELLQKYKKGAMQAIFSQKIRFKDENSKDYPSWQENKLGALATITTGRKDVNAGSPKGKYPFYTCAKDHTYSDYYSFDGEAILIAGNAEVGLCQYYVGKFEAYQRTYVLQNFRILGTYLFRYLSHYFRQYALGLKQTGAMSFIKIGTLNNFNVPVPAKGEQKKIADFLTSLDDKINLTENNLEQAKRFKNSLLQQMFI